MTYLLRGLTVEDLISSGERAKLIKYGGYNNVFEMLQGNFGSNDPLALAGFQPFFFDLGSGEMQQIRDTKADLDDLYECIDEFRNTKSSNSTESTKASKA